MKNLNKKIIALILLMISVIAGIFLLQKYVNKQNSLGEADRTTSRHLIAISSQIRNYYLSNKKLPENLIDISIQSDAIYTKMSEKIYQLCDDFNTQRKPLLDEYDAHDAPNEIGAINYHTKGRDCFKVTMD